jgi:hypothetical protein
VFIVSNDPVSCATHTHTRARAHPTDHSCEWCLSWSMIAGCPQHAPAPCGGTVDLIWINKANFKRLKEGGNAYGPWANRVPSAANFDWFSPVIAFDQGTPTQGYEMPYNVAQVVFFHNTNEVGFLQFLLGSSARSRHRPLGRGVAAICHLPIGEGHPTSHFILAELTISSVLG